MAVDAGVMLLAALALRCWWFGNPVIQPDEQFYLLVGDRLLHGAVPFVDIWDRKPVGLFLVYAAIRWLGGEGILQYQLVATLCAAAAALLVVRIARFHAEAAGARLAGLAVLLWLIVYDGAGGQSPVLYGPLVAGAAALTLSLWVLPRPSGAQLAGRGVAAMALMGVALQIKYSALFEGIGFGLMLLAIGWRAGRSAGWLAAVASIWIGVALAPTALAFAFYAEHGWASPFLFANFRSIGQRPATHPLKLLSRLVLTLGYAAPLLLAAGIALRSGDEPTSERAHARRMIAWWLVAALIGFAGIGTLFRHYFMPVLLPLAALGAPVLSLNGRKRAGWTVALFATGAVFAIGISAHRLHKRGGDGQGVERLAAAIRPRLNGCLYVFDGDPILYHLTGSCLPTRFAFPNHLSDRSEAPAIGVDASQEVRRVLASRPSVIVAGDDPTHNANRATWALVAQALHRDYRPFAAMPYGRHARIAYVRIG